MILARIERLESLIGLALASSGGTPGSDIVGAYSFGPPGSVTPFMAVKDSGASTCALAQADAATNRGFGVVSMLLGATTALVVYTGEVDGFVGLTPGATYYLSPTVAGGITNIAPSAVGQIVQIVGIAKSTTTLFVDVDERFVQL